MQHFKDFTNLGHAVLRKVRLSNAMGAPLALVVIVTTPLLFIAWSTEVWWLMIIAATPVLYFIRAFDYLMLNNPNLLRTEEHEERMLQIQVGSMGVKDDQMSETTADNLSPVAAEQNLLSANTEDANIERGE